MAAPETDLTKVMRVAEGLWERRRPGEAVQNKLAKAYSLTAAARRARQSGQRELADKLDRSANLAMLSAAIHELRQYQHGRELLEQLSLDADAEAREAGASPAQQQKAQKKKQTGKGKR